MNNTSVAILLSTYNGEKYLQEQIDSLSSQTHKNIKILARDDCSDDNSLLILESNDIEVIPVEENVGAKKSFSLLLEYALKNTECKYFMFCDQDDVWKNDKVEKTLLKIQELEKEFKDTPLLIHTDLEVVDEKLRNIHKSFRDFQNINVTKNNFHNLLVQNNITGCTIMINRILANKCLPIPKSAIMHDWWIALVVCKFGNIGFVEEATIQYRQHTSNTIGAKGFNVSFVLRNIFKNLTLDKNIFQAQAFLERFKDELDDKTRKMLEEFVSLDQKTWWQKRRVLWKYKLLKQGFIRNLGMFLKL